MGMKISTVRTSTGLVEKYIGTAYDNVKTVADDIDNVNTVVDNIGSVNIVAPSIDSVNTVAASQDKVDTVADNILDVNTVVSNVADVNIVADNINDVNITADNMPDINAVVENLVPINTNADNMLSINIAATNVSDIHNFTNVWQGAFPTDPEARTTGGALQTGDLYFNTESESIKVWNGLAWSTQAPFAGVREVIELASGQTDVTFTSNLAGANIFVFGTDVDNSRLLQGVDYTPDFSNNTLVLTQTYPEGSLLVSEQADVSTTLDASIFPYTPNNNLSGSVGQALDNRQKVFDNVAAMQADSTLYIGQKVRTLGYHSVGDGGGCDYEIVAPSTAPRFGFLYEQLNNTLEARIISGCILENKMVYIPSDYPTLQEAIDDIHGRIQVKQGVTIELMIETGHQLTTGVFVENGDYGMFQISSVGLEVVLASSFPSMDVVRGSFATIPTLNCVIDANGNGLSGYHAERASKGMITAGNGIKNAHYHGLHAEGASTVYAENTVFTGASKAGTGYSGILSWASTVSAIGADASGSGYYGAQAAASGTLDFRQGIADGAVRHGIRATNSGFVNARSASARNCTVTGVRGYDSGIVHATGVNVDGSNFGLWGGNGGVVVADTASCIGCNIAVFIANGGKVVSRGSTMEVNLNGVFGNVGGGEVDISQSSINLLTSAGAGRIISVIDGAKVLATGISVVNDNDNVSSVRGTGGCEINLRNSVLDSPSVRVIESLTGSKINVTSATITGPSGNVLFIDGGSIISANYSNVGDADMNVTKNTIGSRGIIFK